MSGAVAVDLLAASYRWLRKGTPITADRLRKPTADVVINVPFGIAPHEESDEGLPVPTVCDGALITARPSLRRRLRSRQFR
jgi:hypothetical protein